MRTCRAGVWASAPVADMEYVVCKQFNLERCAVSNAKQRSYSYWSDVKSVKLLSKYTLMLNKTWMFMQQLTMMRCPDKQPTDQRTEPPASARTNTRRSLQQRVRVIIRWRVRFWHLQIHFKTGRRVNKVWKFNRANLKSCVCIYQLISFSLLGTGSVHIRTCTIITQSGAVAGAPDRTVLYTQSQKHSKHLKYEIGALIAVMRAGHFCSTHSSTWLIDAA